jgi:hypothetical protein
LLIDKTVQQRGTHAVIQVTKRVQGRVRAPGIHITFVVKGFYAA